MTSFLYFLKPHKFDVLCVSVYIYTPPPRNPSSPTLLGFTLLSLSLSLSFWVFESQTQLDLDLSKRFFFFFFIFIFFFYTFEFLDLLLFVMLFMFFDLVSLTHVLFSWPQVISMVVFGPDVTGKSDPHAQTPWNTERKVVGVVGFVCIYIYIYIYVYIYLIDPTVLPVRLRWFLISIKVLKIHFPLHSFQLGFLWSLCYLFSPLVLCHVSPKFVENLLI